MNKKTICLTFVILAAILFGGLIYKRNFKNDGMEIHASIEKISEDAAYFCQKDQRWKDDSLGDSPYYMEDLGCLTSCLAAAVNMQNIKIESISSDITPGTLNEFFSDNGVYDDNGNVLWNALENAMNVKVILKDADDLADGELDSIIENACYPIVRVKMPESGNYHFVLLIGSEDGEYLCMDPLNEINEPVSLKKFGNVIYAVRYIENRQ